MIADKNMPVRVMHFNLDLETVRENIPLTLPILGLSLTLPYLEPYLIRTMKEALKHTTDENVAREVKQFIGQEAQHFRQHAKLNELIRQCFPAYEGLKKIEDEMEADYQRFTKTKSLKFNLAYAEGFEAATCAAARNEMKFQNIGSHPSLTGTDFIELFNWHLTEEVEHRTVTFNIYKHLYGDYLYRLGVGAFGQYHFFSYVFRFSKFLAKHYPYPMESDVVANASFTAKMSLIKSLLASYLPTYDPQHVKLPKDYDVWREKYSANAVEIRSVS